MTVCKVLDEPPRAFASALQDASGAISEHLADSPTAVDSAVLQLYFDALQFTRLIDTFGTHSLFDVTLDPGKGLGRRQQVRPCAYTTCCRRRFSSPDL